MRRTHMIFIKFMLYYLEHLTIKYKEINGMFEDVLFWSFIRDNHDIELWSADGLPAEIHFLFTCILVGVYHLWGFHYVIIINFN